MSRFLMPILLSAWVSGCQLSPDADFSEPALALHDDGGGRWSLSFAVVEDIVEWSVCLLDDQPGNATLAIQDVTVNRLILAAAVPPESCVNERDGALGDVVFVPGRLYEIVSFSETEQFVQMRFTPR